MAKRTKPAAPVAAGPRKKTGPAAPVAAGLRKKTGPTPPVTAEARKKSKPKKTGTGASTPADTVRVRMYRQGLGDCFLLTFGADDHVLIDCGLLAGTPDGINKISAVAQKVAEATGGHLRALVVTHEHWDHVSGFCDARDVFEKMTIDEVWVAWTEDSSQGIAKEADKTKKLRLAAIGAAVEGLARSGDPADWTQAGAIADTLGFFGGAASVLGAFSVKTDDAMDWVTDPKRTRKFCSPGDVITRDWLKGVRVHVLGPPKDKEQLADLEGNKQTDMYGMALGLSGEELGMTSALGVDPDAAAWSPFDSALRWEDERDWLDQFHEDFRKSYKAEKWRRVDTDWLGAASDMAMQLDNATNNTSLVLAFELTEGGKVLLFVGDAQIGNWKSWAETAQPLLERTVLYKVGHHGSHNATLKEHGLEAMTSRDLVAMIPVDEKFAKGKKPIPWMMPADKLYLTLLEKTRGRVLRVDRDWPLRDSAKPDGLTASEWKQFSGATRVDDWSIDLVITRT